MDFPNPNRITERAVLRLLTSGSALVLLLLGAVGTIAIQGTRSIEEDTAQAGNEQVMMAGLLGETRAGLNALATALHEVARDPDAINREAVSERLEHDALERSRIAIPTRNVGPGEGFLDTIAIGGAP